MSEMVERVAKVIDDYFAAKPSPVTEWTGIDGLRLAEIVIAAMREPTKEMIVAGGAWIAMIDDALK